ncbi:hypothetical protein LIER_04705 [Lithospermum erythrorhizon]|uniref:Uncharacterized protein n=1 Tax=Lithospermum erythrorhizon TaxID=34254 RepID=A0AAV3NZ10_LITER
MKGRNSFLVMKADNSAANVMITSDFQELGSATKELADHAMMLGAFGLGSSFFNLPSSIFQLFRGDIGKCGGHTTPLLPKTFSRLARIACSFDTTHCASGGFRNCFTKTNGISNTVGIILITQFL